MWTKLPNALSADLAYGETLLWAPHVIEQDGRYWMFYSGGGGDDGSYQIRLATSSDLVTWTRQASPLFIDGFEARDPFVLRSGADWIMYYTATDDPNGGHHIVAYRTSADLVTWSPRAIAYTDSTIGTGAGPTESPFVVARDEGYYLFIGSSEDYRATRVFFSLDPRLFAEPAITHIDAHAPEIVRELDGKQYISHAGWGQGGVFLAPLAWRCAGDR
jgi:arabinan endo-1,5-alpha-L-arabinosidase